MLLSDIYGREDFSTLKEEFLQAIDRAEFNNKFSKEAPQINKLGLKYTINVLNTISILNDIEIDFPAELRYEQYCELQAYEACIDDCIHIVESNINLDKHISNLAVILDDYKYELYPGFLSSSKDILESCIMYNIRNNFKTELKDIIVHLETM